jgi:hypothetical protein
VCDLLLDLPEALRLFVREEPDDRPDDFDEPFEDCFSSFSRRMSFAFSSVCLRSDERFFPPRFS